eukprot:613065-Hanusia_phi.AAC.1
MIGMPVTYFCQCVIHVTYFFVAQKKGLAGPDRRGRHRGRGTGVPGGNLAPPAPALGAAGRSAVTPNPAGQGDSKNRQCRNGRYGTAPQPVLRYRPMPGPGTVTGHRVVVRLESPGPGRAAGPYYY